MTQRSNLAVVYGSNREQRLCDAVGGWALSRLEIYGGFDVDLVDPAMMSLPARMTSEPEETILGFKRSIAHADAFRSSRPNTTMGIPPC